MIAVEAILIIGLYMSNSFGRNLLLIKFGLINNSTIGLTPVLSHLFKTAPILVDNHNLRNRKSLIINNIFFALLH